MLIGRGQYEENKTRKINGNKDEKRKKILRKEYDKKDFM